MILVDRPHAMGVWFFFSGSRVLNFTGAISHPFIVRCFTCLDVKFLTSISGRASAKVQGAQETPTHSHVSPSILEDTKIVRAFAWHFTHPIATFHKAWKLHTRQCCIIRALPRHWTPPSVTFHRNAAWRDITRPLVTIFDISRGEARHGMRPHVCICIYICIYIDR